MKLWRNIDFKVWVGDIETLFSLTTFGFYNPDTQEFKTFEISERTNDLYSFIKWYNRDNIDYVCGFNWRDFDAQVIEYILLEYEKWYDLPAIDICSKIYQKAQDIIDDQTHRYYLNKIKEDKFTIPCIDLFLINGLDNEARKTSLKAAAFQMDGTVEEMPIHHTIRNIASEQIDEVISYMQNDLLETFRLLEITIGETDIKSYQGNNQLELRIGIEEEFGLNCLNLSEIKIGEALLQMYYAKAKGMEVWKLPKKGFFRKKLELKYCIPKYVKFETKQLQDLLESVKSKVIGLDDNLENEFIFGKTKYIQALGGLHSVNNSEIFVEDSFNNLETLDVSSYYPAITVNNGYYPYHLGKELLQVYEEIYRKRIELKPLSKTDKKVKGIVDAFKLVLNSCFGKFGSKESWMYDKMTLLSITLTGQFTLLMLIEMLEQAGIRVVSANSDGVEIFYSKALIDKRNEIVDKWQKITNYEIEQAYYKKIVYSTVNDYIAVQRDGKIKRKGDFEIQDILFKNKSNSIIPIALEKYFVEGIKPEEFINNHNNIYNFVIRAKSNKSFHFEGINQETGEKTVYNKLIRYYIAKEGEKLLKIKNEDCETNAAKVSELNAGDWKSVVCNKIEQSDISKHLQAVNRDFYIRKVREMIYKIESGGKKPKKPKIPTTGMGSLF